jgi:hypothetical protein
MIKATPLAKVGIHRRKETMKRKWLMVLIVVFGLGIAFVMGVWPPFPSVVGHYPPGGALHTRVSDNWPRPEDVLSEALSSELTVFPKELPTSGVVWFYDSLHNPHFFERAIVHQESLKNWQEVKGMAEEIPASSIDTVEMVEVTLRRGGFRKHFDLDNFPFRWFAVVRAEVEYDDGNSQRVDFWLEAGKAWPNGTRLAQWQLVYATPVS